MRDVYDIADAPMALLGFMSIFVLDTVWQTDFLWVPSRFCSNPTHASDQNTVAWRD
jgi:hypothetical protein